MYVYISPVDYKTTGSIRLNGLGTESYSFRYGCQKTDAKSKRGLSKTILNVNMQIIRSVQRSLRVRSKHGKTEELR